MKKVSRQRVNVRTHKAHKDGHKKTRPVVSMATKAGEAPRHARLGERTKGQSALATDRKSTRLNSSHSQISYAVFCLKKKKIATKAPCLLRKQRNDTM